MAPVIARLLHPFVHAHAGTSGAVLDQPVVGQQERVAQKHVTPKWVDGLLAVVLAIAIVLAIAAFVPKVLLGWDVRWTGTGQGSWSMAKEGGVMPCSYFYVAKAEEYRVGDIVSFWYTDPARPGAAEESTVKRVISVKTNGTLVCRGDNQPNSDRGEYIVPRDKIRGKVAGPRDSFLPTAYWRWLSMEWTLQADEIAAREREIFSLRTIISVFTPNGRLRNRVVSSYKPSEIAWRSREGDVWSRIIPGLAEMYVGEELRAEVRYDRLLDSTNPWQDGGFVFTATKDGFPALMRWTPEGGEEVVRSYSPVVVRQTLRDGTKLCALSATASQDPVAALDGRGWGPVLANSGAGHYNYWEIEYTSLRIVNAVRLKWSGGESVAISCSSDGKSWRSIVVAPPGGGGEANITLDQPVSSRFWRAELVNNESKIEGVGMTLYCIAFN